jgi:hypothetical protein
VPDHASKRCRKCGEIKPDGEFHRDRSKRDGRSNVCRDCERQRYQANREAKLAYFARYYQDHGQDLRDYQRRYRETHSEKISERDKRYYVANRDKLLDQSRQWEQANRDKVNALQRARMARYKDAVLEHYGRACACCQSTRNLGIDHINGGGGQHREELFGQHRRAGSRFNFWLIKNNFPPGYQTLCSPCNTSKGTGDRCRIDHDLEYDAENDAW